MKNKIEYGRIKIMINLPAGKVETYIARLERVLEQLPDTELTDLSIDFDGLIELLTIGNLVQLGRVLAKLFFEPDPKNYVWSSYEIELLIELLESKLFQDFIWLDAILDNPELLTVRYAHTRLVNSLFEIAPPNKLSVNHIQGQLVTFHQNRPDNTTKTLEYIETLHHSREFLSRIDSSRMILYNTDVRTVSGMLAEIDYLLLIYQQDLNREMFGIEADEDLAFRLQRGEYGDQGEKVQLVVKKPPPRPIVDTTSSYLTTKKEPRSSNFGHPEYCNCLWCENSRKTEKTAFSPHASECKCFQCQSIKAITFGPSVTPQPDRSHLSEVKGVSYPHEEECKCYICNAAPKQDLTKYGGSCAPGCECALCKTKDNYYFEVVMDRLRRWKVEAKYELLTREFFNRQFNTWASPEAEIWFMRNELVKQFPNRLFEVGCFLLQSTPRHPYQFQQFLSKLIRNTKTTSETESLIALLWASTSTKEQQTFIKFDKAGTTNFLERLSMKYRKLREVDP